jgi:hypothetical protein
MRWQDCATPVSLLAPTFSIVSVWLATDLKRALRMMFPHVIDIDHVDVGQPNQPRAQLRGIRLPGRGSSIFGGVDIAEKRIAPACTLDLPIRPDPTLKVEGRHSSSSLAP